MPKDSQTVANFNSRDLWGKKHLRAVNIKSFNWHAEAVNKGLFGITQREPLTT